MYSIDFWRTVTITGAALGQTLFVVLYLTFPWWKTFLGRALFLKAVTFCVLLDVAVAGRVWDWPGEDATFVCLYGAVALGVWAQFAAFLRTKRCAGKSEKAFGSRQA